jgi:hypothetical protein
VKLSHRSQAGLGCFVLANHPELGSVSDSPFATSPAPLLGERTEAVPDLRRLYNGRSPSIAR